MNEVTLPPSPNWFLSSILTCSNEIVAWGARKSIIILKKQENSKVLDYLFIDRAHSIKINSLSLLSKNDEMKSSFIISCGDENRVKVWNLEDLTLEKENITLKDDAKIIAVDWFKSDPKTVAYVSEDGLLVIWNTENDNTKVIALGKLFATCLSCCPHASNMTAVGSKSGLIYIINTQGKGKILYKLRGHDAEICSLSWCPVSWNVFDEDPNKDQNDCLLASGAKDRFIYLWKAGSDGRYDIKLTLPPNPMDTSRHKGKVSSGNWTSVNWLEPFTLLSSSPWGELLLWDIIQLKKKKNSPKLLHALHSRGLFSISALSSITDSFSENHSSVPKNKITIWSAAQDRLIICCNLENNESKIHYNIPTLGGFVYCLAACPVDTSLIAFGVGDAMIRVWNLSEPHENTFDVTMLWEKIKGHVRTLAWHLEKENQLAFGTNEGRVGVFDTNTVKPPILLRQYHRHNVYRIGWGPAPEHKDHVLYSCGDGELIYYDINKINDKPIFVSKEKGCLEFSWKPDFSVMALGFEDGRVSFLNKQLKKTIFSIHTLKKAIHHLVWHPESTVSDLEISKYHNYLAVGTNDSVISIFEIFINESSENVHLEQFGEQTDSKSNFKLIATLNGHSNRIICLAWSPHISGYLVSGSYDFTAKVWKVENQECIATYSTEISPIYCCMWSPLCSDLILIGSTDFTLRMWRISTHTAAKCIRKIRTKSKKPKVKINVSTQDINNTEIVKEHATKEAGSKDSKKRKNKKQITFPIHSKVTNDKTLWLSSVKSLFNTVLEDKAKSASNLNNSISPINGDLNQVSDYKYSNIEINVQTPPLLLGNSTQLKEALNNEKSVLATQGNHHIVTEIDFWMDNLKENLEIAKKDKLLTEYSVSLAASISIETWKEVCEAYANQLINENNPHKAVSYLLCINKINEAIEVYINEKLYKEAYVLAANKFGSDNQFVESILKSWAEYCTGDGLFETAIECYIKLKDFSKAIQFLVRRKDPDILNFAIDIAAAENNHELTIRLADEAISLALINNDVISAKSVLKKVPTLQYREVHIEIHNIIVKVFESLNDYKICDLLSTTWRSAIVNECEKYIENMDEKGHLLFDKNYFPSVENEMELQVHISYKFCLYLISKEPKEKLLNLIKTFLLISQFESSHKEVFQGKLSYSVKFLYILDVHDILHSSQFSNEVGYFRSFCAYYCTSILNWFLKCKTSQLSDKKNLVEKIFVIMDRYAEDIVVQESFKFWAIQNEIKNLETQISTALSEDINVIDRLNEIKKEESNFIQLRVFVPNPMDFMFCLQEFSKLIKEEEKKLELQKKLDLLWSRTSEKN